LSLCICRYREEISVSNFPQSGIVCPDPK